MVKPRGLQPYQYQGEPSADRSLFTRALSVPIRSSDYAGGFRDRLFWFFV
jgi:hypothetical protein